jgi:septal ring-binding cell division protein DamX
MKMTKLFPNFLTIIVLILALSSCAFNEAGSNGNSLSDGAGVNDHEADSDGDGLSDDAEMKDHKTDPLNPDTDDDGIIDGQEILGYNTDTDPLSADTDEDGLSDGMEVTKYNTDPLSADTDEDGLTDGEEINSFNTDPLAADSDGDGLIDGAEVFYRNNRVSEDRIESRSLGKEFNRGNDDAESLAEPTPEQQAAAEQARQDSLHEVARAEEAARQEALRKQAEAERTALNYDEDGMFVVQLSAWRSADKAETRKSYWIDQGFEHSSVVEVGDQSTGEIWYRVRIGTFANKQDASKAVTLLKDDYNTKGWNYHLNDAEL